MTYSVVVPAHNEEASIEPLYDAVKKMMDELVAENPFSPFLQKGGSDGSWELIYIDDGSRDATLARMQAVRARDPRVKIIAFRRQFGQTAGWSAGFDHARGEYVIVLDSDLQNDPQDIPAMLAAMQAEGLDVISGWRKNRKDNGALMFLSKLGNWVHRRVTGEKIHDHGCSLKIYKKEALEDLELYGEMHRYITALLSWKGFKVGEIAVRHHPRRSGRTKYSVRKKLKGFLDLIVVKFWIQYSARPMHFFGLFGAGFIAAGLLLGGTLGSLWLMRITGFANSSLPLAAVVLVLLGFQFLLSGVLADVVAHTYYAKRKAYSIKSVDGFK
ncbi:MAG: glycosyltransferase [Candidatus Andersenbacteria bacterium CG10_big_fil_rev_8_21_14_0_10_54_11]|uniref:Glycosyltransferase n=1 Tax=Candidatus Andersenbacteria bacterium CG10_big_fil_rev_8_21_14_0_10_54_11 TaxID=1974485 RepID=A0A2M6WYA7_9BACT|nr:MAG: glycosyltransferase [Candidatus Andersenbacteria bacterium CG10_big_fil_rev_8_21_14_0_10_54_11]